MKRFEHLFPGVTPPPVGPAETSGLLRRFRRALFPLIAVLAAVPLAGAPAPSQAPKAAAVESAALPAEDAVDPAILARGKSADKKKYPDADNVLLYEKEHYVYDLSGTWRTFCESYAKILTEKGREELRTLSFYFNTNYTRTRVKQITVISPDGRKTHVDPVRNGRVVIDSSQMGSNIYDPACRYLTVPLPKLEVGDILYYRFENEHFKCKIPGFWGTWTLLQSDWPIVENVVEIDAPAALPLRSIALKGEVKGTVSYTSTKGHDRTLHRWRALNVPQVIREPGMPAFENCVQRLLVSTASSWEEVSRWYWKLCRPRLDAVTPAMKQCVAGLVKGKKSDMEKVKAIFQFVSQNIRYMGITTEKEAPGYEPHDVSLTFSHRYGVCRDKAALLVSMLELAGFKAYPVLFMAGAPKDPEIPNGSFNHAITAVELEKDKFTLMDPTFESTRELFPAFEADMSYLVAHPEGRKLARSPVVPAEKNRLVIRTKSKLNAENQLTGETEIELFGANDVWYRGALSRWSTEQRKAFFLGRLRKAVPGARLIELKITPENIRDMSKPLKFFLSYSVEVQSSYLEWLIQMPGMASVFGVNEGFFDGVTGLLTRKYPVKLLTTCLAEEYYTVELPPTCRVLALPGSEAFGVGSKIRWDLHTENKDNRLNVTKRFVVNALELTAPEYAELKKSLSRLNTFRAALPLAENDFRLKSGRTYRSSFPGADSVIEDLVTTITVKDASNWKEKTHTRRKILNYAGVKAHSEVKMAYVPAWESVSVRARVTGPDGKVRELGPNEINIMDSPRNSSGPRYPAGKILVASLPGVAVGSLIELETTRERRDRNFFYAEVPFFSFTSPIIRRRLVVVTPDRFPLRSEFSGRTLPLKESHDGNSRTRVWEIEDVPRMRRETRTPPWRFFAPGVLLSSGDSRIFVARLKDALQKKCNASLPAARRLAEEKKWDQLPTEQAVRAIRDYVDKNIRTCDIALGDIPLSSLSEAGVTLRSGYGHSADKAILLGALLKSVGVEFSFVGSSGIGYAEQSFRSFSRSFDLDALTTGILVYVPSLKCYLNDTSRYALLGTVAREYCLGLDLNTGRIINILPRTGAESEQHLRFHITCLPDLSAEVAIEVLVSGRVYEALNEKYSTATPERRRHFFEEQISTVSHDCRVLDPGSTDFKKYPGVLRSKFIAKGLISGVGPYRVLMLPRWYELLGRSGSSQGGSDRTLPLWRNTRSSLKVDYLIVPPPGFEAIPGREPRFEIGRYGSSTFSENYSAQPDRIILRCRKFLPVEMVDVLDYCELENRQRILSQPSAGRIVMKRISAKERER